MSSPSIYSRQYYTGNYPNDHWALQPFTQEDPKVIALVFYKSLDYAIYVNPTDKRGCRCIVRLISHSDMLGSINRDYTAKELRGLSLIVEFVERVFLKIFPIVQTFKAGNNSHKFDPKNHVVHIGHAEEPSFLHTHIIARGDPEAEYIPGIKLGGPAPGLNFDMMGKTVNEPGNDKKNKWKDGEMEKAVNCFKVEIEKSKYEFPELVFMPISSNY